MIEIVFRNGDMAHYDMDAYTDYKYDSRYFIVIYDKQWIGLYNLDAVEYITIERAEPFAGAVTTPAVAYPQYADAISKAIPTETKTVEVTL